MKKILFFTSNLGSGGAERQMVTLAKLLKREGYNIDFLCITKGDFFKKELEENNITIHHVVFENNKLLNFLKLSLFKAVIVVNRFLENKNYDVVISFLPTPNFLNSISTIINRRRKVITGERSATNLTFKSKRRKLFAWFQTFSDNIVCNSNNAKNLWSKYFPQHTNKLSTIYNCVTLPSITSNYVVRRNKKLSIVIAASYQHLKNPIGLIKALSQLNEEERKKIEINWYGRIIENKNGNSAYKEASSLISENKLQNIIHLNEETKDIANKMNSADVVALFSSSEGLPNAICEGMMIGKPIIMSRVSDYSTLVDNSNGFLCDWDNIESIKEVLRCAMDLKKEQLLEMGNNSKKKAEKLFSSGAIVKKWIEVIEN